MKSSSLIAVFYVNSTLETDSSIDETGKFNILYTTGGSDQNATNISILLVKSSYLPGKSYQDAKKNALDCVDVIRTSSGSIDITPSGRTQTDTTDTDENVSAVEGVPSITITKVPAFRKIEEPIMGIVTNADGSAIDNTKYAISMFVQVNPNEQAFVKPTYNYPLTAIMEDGSFEGYFVTGGMDNEAKLIHVLLVDSQAFPQYLEDTISYAVDYVLITRDANGNTRIIDMFKQT